MVAHAEADSDKEPLRVVEEEADCDEQLLALRVVVGVTERRALRLPLPLLLADRESDAEAVTLRVIAPEVEADALPAELREGAALVLSLGNCVELAVIECEGLSVAVDGVDALELDVALGDVAMLADERGERDKDAHALADSERAEDRLSDAHAEADNDPRVDTDARGVMEFPASLVDAHAELVTRAVEDTLVESATDVVAPSVAAELFVG